MLASSRFEPSDEAAQAAFQSLHVKASPHDLGLFVEQELVSVSSAKNWTNPRLRGMIEKDQALRDELIRKSTSGAGDMFVPRVLPKKSKAKS